MERNDALDLAQDVAGNKTNTTCGVVAVHKGNAYGTNGHMSVRVAMEAEYPGETIEDAIPDGYDLPRVLALFRDKELCDDAQFERVTINMRLLAAAINAVFADWTHDISNIGPLLKPAAMQSMIIALPDSRRTCLSVLYAWRIYDIFRFDGPKLTAYISRKDLSCVHVWNPDIYAVAAPVVHRTIFQGISLADAGSGSMVHACKDNTILWPRPE